MLGCRTVAGVVCSGTVDSDFGMQLSDASKPFTSILSVDPVSGNMWAALGPDRVECRKLRGTSHVLREAIARHQRGFRLDSRADHNLADVLVASEGSPLSPDSRGSCRLSLSFLR